MDLHFAPETFAADLHRDILLAEADRFRLIKLAKAARAAARRRTTPAPDQPTGTRPTARAAAGKPARNRRYAV